MVLKLTAFIRLDVKVLWVTFRQVTWARSIESHEH